MGEGFWMMIISHLVMEIRQFTHHL